MVLASGPALVLKRSGFKKKGNRFFRVVGNLAQVVSFQKSQWDEEAGTQFTVNLGVVSPLFHEVWTGNAKPKSPESGHPILTARLGQLMPENTDRWWNYGGSDEEDEATGAEVQSLLLEFGLPFLDRNQAERDILLTLRDTSLTPAILNKEVKIAVLLHGLGDEEEARACLQSFRSRTTQPEVLVTILDRIGYA